ncbi:hypothetical protein [Embleya sp. NPDC020630]|uniref:hypothetical protein n=1 Tax=Embleya sp. NPDC020630 TaxID=3363979 RepID=UPI0037BC3653
MSTEVDGLGFVGITWQRGYGRVLCSTAKPEEKLFEFGSPPSGSVSANAHSGVTLDTSWDLAYYTETGVVTELTWKSDTVAGKFWPQDRHYTAFHWSATDKSLLAARMDSATVDKYGAPVKNSRVLVDPIQYSIGSPTANTPFSDIALGPEKTILFGLQESASGTSLAWGKLQPAHEPSVAGTGGASSVDFGVARWLAVSPTSGDTFVMGTPEGNAGKIQRFNATQTKSTDAIAAPAGWQCYGRPVIATAANRQYCCVPVRKGTGKDSVWGIAVVDILDFTAKQAAVISLSDAYGVAPLAVNPSNGKLYAIKIFSSSPGKTGLEVVAANPAKPTENPTTVTTWHSSLDIYSDAPEHLWCFAWR